MYENLNLSNLTGKKMFMPPSRKKEVVENNIFSSFKDEEYFEDLKNRLSPIDSTEKDFLNNNSVFEVNESSYSFAKGETFSRLDIGFENMEYEDVLLSIENEINNIPMLNSVKDLNELIINGVIISPSSWEEEIKGHFFGKAQKLNDKNYIGDIRCVDPDYFEHRTSFISDLKLSKNMKNLQEGHSGTFVVNADGSLSFYL